jgi:hypothetical protein
MVGCPQALTGSGFLLVRPPMTPTKKPGADDHEESPRVDEESIGGHVTFAGRVTSQCRCPSIAGEWANRSRRFTMECQHRSAL